MRFSLLASRRLCAAKIPSDPRLTEMMSVTNDSQRVIAKSNSIKPDETITCCLPSSM